MRVVQGQLQEAGAPVALKVAHATGYAMIWAMMPAPTQGPIVNIMLTATNALNIHRHLTYPVPCKYADLAVSFHISFDGMPGQSTEVTSHD